MKGKHDTQQLIAPLQQTLSAKLPSARIDMRQLEASKVGDVPMQILIVHEDIALPRARAEAIKTIFRAEV